MAISRRSVVAPAPTTISITYSPGPSGARFRSAASIGGAAPGGSLRLTETASGRPVRVSRRARRWSGGGRLACTAEQTRLALIERLQDRPFDVDALGPAELEIRNRGDRRARTWRRTIGDGRTKQRARPRAV